MGLIKKGTNVRRERLIIYGPGGVGKTTFAVQAPGVMVINLNKGLVDNEIPRAGEDVKDWKGLTKLLDDLIKDPEFAAIETVVLDTVNDAERLCINYLLNEVGGKNHQPVQTLNDVGNGFGSGTNMLLECMRQLYSYFDRMWEMGKRIIFTAHEKLETVKNPDGWDYQRYNMSVQDKVAALYVGNVDAVLFARTDMTVTNQVFDKKRAKALDGDGRFLYTTEKAGWVAKNRYELPEKLPLDWYTFVSHVSADKATLLHDSIRALARTYADLVGKNDTVEYVEKLIRDGANHGKLVGTQNSLRVKLKEVRAKMAEQEASSEPASVSAN